MKFVIVSGRSGSGKSTALHVLEDLGYYCIDNLPVGLLTPLAEEMQKNAAKRVRNVAVSIDARNLSGDISHFESLFEHLRRPGLRPEIIYLDATDQSLLERFHATRRRHPLSGVDRSLKEAISAERVLLEPIARLADFRLDTTQLSMYELRDTIKQRIAGRTEQELSILVQSFGFKHGVPVDSDYVFDVRCLPNPHWDTRLRSFSGLDTPVQHFLEAQPDTLALLDDIKDFLTRWLPRFQNTNRSYMTISIGCTGGQHRSVYMAEKLGAFLCDQFGNVQIRHTELPTPPPAGPTGDNGERV